MEVFFFFFLIKARLWHILKKIVYVKDGMIALARAHPQRTTIAVGETARSTCLRAVRARHHLLATLRAKERALLVARLIRRFSIKDLLHVKVCA